MTANPVEFTRMPTGIAERRPPSVQAFRGVGRRPEAQPQADAQPEGDQGEHDNLPGSLSSDESYREEVPAPIAQSLQLQQAPLSVSVASAFHQMAAVLDRIDEVEKVSLSIPVSGTADQQQMLVLELTCAKVQVLADCVNLLYNTKTSMPRIPYGVQMGLRAADGTEVTVLSLGHSFQFEGTHWQLMSFAVVAPSSD